MLLILVSVLPVLIIGFFVYINDREKESISLLLKLLSFGAMCSVPIIVVEAFLRLYFPISIGNSLFSNFFNILISIALVEEFFKYIVTYLVTYNHKDFCNLYDMIVYATFVSLGFALIENIFYIIDGGVGVGIMRALFSVPGHACYGVIMGYYLGLSKIYLLDGSGKEYKLFKFLSLFFPILMHTFYDFCLFSNSLLLLILFLVYILYIYILCIVKINSVSKNYSDFIKKETSN